MPKFISSFFPSSLSEIEKADLSAFSGTDMIEWRADAMPADEVLAAAPIFFEKFKDFQILFTLRTVEEGGSFNQSEFDYNRILKQILTEFSPTFVDVEALSKPAVLENLKEFMPILWLSYHNFKEMPKNLAVMMAELAGKKPAAAKIAVTPHDMSEVWELLYNAARFRKSDPTPLIAIAMGQMGRISRLTCDSPWTFVSAGNQSKYGQFTLSEARQLVKMLEADHAN
jgi:3-dehydroquinate dehydratase-1